MHLHHDPDSPGNLFNAHVVLRAARIGSKRADRVPIRDALTRLGSKMKPGCQDRATFRAAHRVPAQSIRDTCDDSDEAA